MVFQIFILVSALCLDTFVASAAYGTNQVELTRLQIAVFNGICSDFLGISLLFGTFIDDLIPETFTRGICFFSLLFLGLLKLAKFGIRRYRCDIPNEPGKYALERHKQLSWRELLFFSLAMSIDSLITGSMAAFLKISIPLTVVMNFLIGELFTHLGLFLGRRISRECPRDLSWIGGLLFIILAILKR